MAGTINSFVIGAILVFVIALDTTSLLLATAAVAALLSSVHCTTLLNEVRLLYPGLKMDTQAYDLLMVMRNSDVAIETKASLIGTLKSDIKNRHVPENAVSYIFEIVRTAIASPHSSLSSAGFTTLGYLMKRLNLQDQLHVIASQGPKTYPILMERIGDHKEKVRDQAAQAFTEFWSASPVEVEHFILEGGLTSKSARAKERSLAWLLQMSQERGLLFRNYVPKVVDCLEDADGVVRETAKAIVIELFQNAPDRAKVDLKKQLQLRNVRKAIATSIVSQLNLPNSEGDFKSSYPKPHMAQQDSAISMTFDDSQRPSSVASFRSTTRLESSKSLLSSKPSIAHADALAAHSNSKSDSTKQKASAAFAPLKADLSRQDAQLPLDSLDDSIAQGHGLSTTDDDGKIIDPIYVNSSKEFDEIIRDMLPPFEGRESEGNWSAREKNVLKLRRLTRGNAPQDYNNSYVAGIKTLLDGILKVVNSLRTTVSTNGCQLVQDVARMTGPGLDSMVEILLQSLIKLCGGTKKISAQNGNVTVDAIIGNGSYHIRLLHHLWNASQDKNVQPRLFATGWLKTLILKHGRQRSAIEHSGGLELIEKTIKKGLTDANPGVRESMRGTYWTFARIWPEKAEAIMSTLDAKSLGLLEKDPGNPNRVPTVTASARPILPHSTTSISTRPSLKETIAAQKRLAAQGIPARPESAQSIFSDTKPSATPKTSRPPPVAAATTQAIPTILTAPVQNAKTLSSAPMRPPVRPPRRPEIPRPATADPYASRRMMNAGSHSKTNSPTETPLKTRPKTALPTVAPPISSTSPVRQLRKPSPSTSPMKAKTKKPDPSRMKESEARPMATPAMKASTLRLFDVAAHQASPTRANEDFTMVMPSVQTMSDTELPSTRRDSAISKDRLPSIGKHSPTSSDGLSNVENLKVYEDPVPTTTGEVQSESHAIAGGFETPRASMKVSALEELPVNEPATLPLRPRGFPTEFEAVSPLNGVGARPSENSHRRWNKVEAAEKRKSVSPRSRDPDQARLMLDNGITKIRAKNLDVHGYRKLQGLIKEHDNIFKDEAKFDDLLLALLDSLEAPNDERRTALGRPLDLKTQVLVTTRLMFAHNKLYFSAYYPRAMSAVISARKYYDSKDHIVSGLEETTEDIASACDPGDVIDAILDVLETEERNEAGYRTISMGIYVLSGLLHRLNVRKMTMEKSDLKRLGKLAFRSIRDTHPDIRRAVIDYCLELRDMVEPEEEFWPMINDSVEDYRALLTYYIIRRPSRV